MKLIIDFFLILIIIIEVPLYGFILLLSYASGYIKKNSFLNYKNILGYFFLIMSIPDIIFLIITKFLYSLILNNKLIILLLNKDKENQNLGLDIFFKYYYFFNPILKNKEAKENLLQIIFADFSIIKKSYKELLKEYKDLSLEQNVLLTIGLFCFINLITIYLVLLKSKL